MLGQAGVLDGHRVTTHWAMASEFRAAFPRAHLVEHALYVDDGQVLSSGGMLAATDLCLYLLAARPGSGVRQRRLPVAGQPTAPGGRAGPVRQGVPAVADRPAGAGAGLAGGEHRASRSGCEDVAARAHMSARTLVRRFRAETGEGLAEWVARRRVERARALLEETDRPVAQVAHDAGFRLGRGAAPALPGPGRNQPAGLSRHASAPPDALAG